MWTSEGVPVCVPGGGGGSREQSKRRDTGEETQAAGDERRTRGTKTRGKRDTQAQVSPIYISRARACIPPSPRTLARAGPHSCSYVQTEERSSSSSYVVSSSSPSCAFMHPKASKPRVTAPKNSATMAWGRLSRGIHAPSPSHQIPPSGLWARCSGCFGPLGPTQALRP